MSDSTHTLFHQYERDIAAAESKYTTLKTLAVIYNIKIDDFTFKPTFKKQYQSGSTDGLKYHHRSDIDQYMIASSRLRRQIESRFDSSNQEIQCLADDNKKLKEKITSMHRSVKDLVDIIHEIKGHYTLDDTKEQVTIVSGMTNLAIGNSSADDTHKNDIDAKCEQCEKKSSTIQLLRRYLNEDAFMKMMQR